MEEASNTSVRFVSLFSGVGGMDLGLERSGMRCVAQVEKDEYRQRVLAASSGVLS